MRIAIIATCGLAFLWESGVRAQEFLCPERPPLSVHSSQLSLEFSASFFSRLLAGIGLGASREVKFEDVLRNYPNPGELLFKAQNISIQCKLIMGNSEWDIEEKRKLIGELYQDVAYPSPQPTPYPSPPSYGVEPAALEISGRYFATGIDSAGRPVDLVLDIRSGYEGTFVGNLGPPDLPQNTHLIVEGRTIGDAVAFTARNPTPYYDWFINFEGKFTGASISGRSRVVSPSQGATPWEPLEFAASRRSTLSPPTPVPYVDPGRAPQIAQRPEMCCVYDPANWCAPWSSRPGRAYENENITYAELGSACYCPGRDEPGQVMPANGFCS